MNLYYTVFKAIAELQPHATPSPPPSTVSVCAAGTPRRPAAKSFTLTCYSSWEAKRQVNACHAGLEITQSKAKSRLEGQKNATTKALAEATTAAAAAADAYESQLRAAEETCVARINDIRAQFREKMGGEGDRCKCQAETDVDVEAATQAAVQAARIAEVEACDTRVREQTEKTSIEYSQAVLEADAHVLRAVLEKFNATLSADWTTELAEQPERGILFLAGPEIYMLNTFVSLWAIRRYWNCTLPVAIVYWGETEKINQATRDFFFAELGQPNVEFIDASKDMPWPAHHRQLLLPAGGRRPDSPGWALKLAASYLVKFQEVLYFDSDAAPLVPPESLFELPSYKKSGALFWPDTPCSRPEVFNDLIKMGLMNEEDAPKEQDEPQTEAGMWLLDRRRHREPLEYIMLLANHADFTFSRAFGDKDLFRAGFALAGAASQYVLSPQKIGFAWGPPDLDKYYSRIMRGYIQFSAKGQPLFHHRTGWEAKYVFHAPEGRPLDAISGPLPCAWTNRDWPFEYPGARDDFSLRLVDVKNCSYALDGTFGTAVEKISCNEDFEGAPGQRMPIYSIKGSVLAEVHAAQEKGWKRLLAARQMNPLLFTESD